MTHIPNEIDIKTDLRRAIMASYSLNNFEDSSSKIFLENALKNLELLKNKVGQSKFLIVKERIKKSMDSKKPLEKRREDLLTASSLI